MSSAVKNKHFTFFKRANLLIISIGITYFIYKEFLKINTEFGVQANPATKYIMYAHILTVPFLIFAFGWLWPIHITKMKGKSQKRKITGNIIYFLFPVLVLSGYLNQMSLFDSLHEAKELLHLVSAGIWVVATSIHLYLKK